MEKKIVAEIDQFIKGDKLPSWEEVNQLRYCNMVVKEVLRMFPPASAFSRRLTHDTKLGNYTIPKGVKRINFET